MIAATNKTARRPWWQRLFGLGGRHLTPAERAELDAERAEIKRQKLLKHQLDMEASVYENAILRTLESMNVCYRYKKSEGGLERVRRVRFQSPIYVQEEAIHFRIDTRGGQLPRGIGMAELSDENLLKTLSLSCGHPVSFTYRPEAGAWYTVERIMGVRGIPSHVDYNSVLQGRPASASGLYLPLGISNGKKALWKDLGAMPHLLIGGTTGAGKSNLANVILCTLLRYNPPRRLRLVLVDLKGGVEFAPYLGVPHIWKVKGEGGEDLSAVVERRDDVLPWFNRILAEGERRLTALKDAGVKHIGQHNSKHPTRPWPHIVVVIDEWADVRLMRGGDGAKAEEILINMASRFRVTGIHLIVMTQVPNREVVPLRLKTVLPCRIAFSVPNSTASITIIGSGAAAGLEPTGRAILDWGKTNHEFQAPRITDEAIDRTKVQAIAGSFQAPEVGEHDVTAAEIFEWAVAENIGHLDYRGLYAHFRRRGMPEAWAQSFCKMVEGEIVVVGATTYRVHEASGNAPRRLLPVELDLEPDEDPAPPAAPPEATMADLQQPAGTPAPLATSGEVGQPAPATANGNGHAPAAPVKRPRGRPRKNPPPPPP